MPKERPKLPKFNGEIIDDERIAYYSHKKIKNLGKHERREVVVKQQRMKKYLARKRSFNRPEGEEKPERASLEKKRTNLDTLITEENIDQVMEEDEVDEFAKYFDEKETPKILVTTSWDDLRQTSKATPHLTRFIADFMTLVPNCFYVKRHNYKLKEVIEYGKERGFTMIVVVGQVNGWPRRLIMSKLPEGPTATFRVSSFMHTARIKNRASSSDYFPELIMNNFSSSLGHRLGRFIHSLFPSNPEFTGRRVATFHNQRDFIFVRHHRYEFRSKEKVQLQEIGPRFTLKLLSLQLGTFNPKYGEFEWYFNKKNLIKSQGQKEKLSWFLG